MNERTKKQKRETSSVFADPKAAKDQCLAEINAVLEKHGCDLVPVPQFKADGRGAWFVTTTIAVVKL